MNKIKIVRIEGNIYRIITAMIGKKRLVSAECTYGPEKGNSIWNLTNSRTKRANQIRDLIRMGLVS